ncbi:Proteins of 100 residues with WXG [Parafrankia irregularis]|uniref:Proteins of 100 residues with WXG n=1 Tax=Parafrankia irregularis TaxID=795642 RepID=A0A0S4QNI5_9ACTN|nr:MULTISPECIES: WXG100 family type VII secretion target [Parafrankia]MBE3202273.1 WXG100 family type VII secretion target [Parafrankia sp. CH37]CUU56042.1 Proteins of 100 residues with WXG [Parafrankia irregularis]
MPNPALISDEASTVAMITAFDNCQDECAAIQNAIDSAASQLFSPAGWQGVAAAKYRDALSGWQAGFNKVQQGLNMLNESMVVYANTTTSVEDNNAMIGSGWAEGLT